MLLPDLVHGMADLVRTSLGPSVLVEASFPLSLPPVMADANQLELCLLNLAVNARDAMPDGGTLTISARAESVQDGRALGIGPGQYVRLSLADTGEGMDEATLSRATEPFFTTKGVGKGTGLGLSMVHGIVQQCGGALRLSSTRPGGTTVDIWLPVAGALGLGADAPRPSRHRRITPRPWMGGRRRSLWSTTTLWCSRPRSRCFALPATKP